MDNSQAQGSLSPAVNERLSSVKRQGANGTTTITRSLTPNRLSQRVYGASSVAASINDQYYSSDLWWKQPMRVQRTFSVADIAAWPEYEQTDKYFVQVKHITST
jgi:hypothetical protein